MIYRVIESFSCLYYPVANVGKPKKVQLIEGDLLYAGINYGYGMANYLFTSRPGLGGYPTVKIKEAENDLRLLRIK